MASSNDSKHLRPRYFDRQQLKAEDLTLEQTYINQRFRRLNRYLHGCGVVCGLEVRPKNGLQVIVTPGYALSPQGDEIFVPSEQTVSIKPTKDKNDKCLNIDTKSADEGQEIYLVIRYLEENVQPVPAMPEQCKPVEKWEYSRIQEGFEISCLNSLPETCIDPVLDCIALSQQIYGQQVPYDGVDDTPPLDTCPPETVGSWVVLARLNLGLNDKLIIDYSVRSQVLTARILAETLRCPAITEITPNEGQQGTTVDAIISGWGPGQHFAGTTEVVFSGTGISTKVLSSSNTILRVRINIALGATTGERIFKIITPRDIFNSDDFGISFLVWSVYGYVYGYNMDSGIGIGGGLV